MAERWFSALPGLEHPPYGAFCPAPGHQLGFSDLKVIEAAEFLRGISQGKNIPGFQRRVEV